MSLSRVAIVTGAAGGIGGACALALAQDGLDIAVSDLPGKDLTSIVKQIEDKGRKDCTCEGELEVAGGDTS